jgi:preprotein translocase SecE subunit
MAFVIALAGIFGVMSLHNHLPAKSFRIPGINWQMDWRFLVEAPVLVAVLAWGVYLYNKPKVVDFLIDTEHELKNRVTWPSKKEEINASVVVVVTVIIMMAFIFAVDQAFHALKTWIYSAF